jgi:hypothetical protein
VLATPDAAEPASRITELADDPARRQAGRPRSRRGVLFTRDRQAAAHARVLSEVADYAEARVRPDRLRDRADGLRAGVAPDAMAIKLDDGGPVMFPQERVGRHGRVFLAYKFRSMVVDAERLTGAVQATENDPRVTRVGRILRATAFDELPQLWNIFRGDMSVVGPRPLRPGEADTTADGTHLPLSAIPGYEARHRVRPGLTGLAQVYAAETCAHWQVPLTCFTSGGRASPDLRLILRRSDRARPREDRGRKDWRAHHPACIIEPRCATPDIGGGPGGMTAARALASRPNIDRARGTRHHRHAGALHRRARRTPLPH